MATDKQNNDKDFPGYPHYPASEDATQPKNNNGIVSTDTEKDENTDTKIDGDLDIVMGTEADVTPEEREMLAATDDYQKVDSVDADGDLLNESNDLDIPGSEQDDANEAIGEEDEENNYYSLGDNDTTEDPNADLR